MTWYSWLALGAILAITVWIWCALYGDKSGPNHCVGCGKCVTTGECVLKRGKKGEKPASRLDKSHK